MKLKKFLMTYNFRYYDENQDSEDLKDGTYTIRIKPYINNKYIGMHDNHIEFGVYDWTLDSTKRKTIELCLSQQLLNSKVTEIRFNPDIQLVEVFVDIKDK